MRFLAKIDRAYFLRRIFPCHPSMCRLPYEVKSQEAHVAYCINTALEKEEDKQACYAAEEAEPEQGKSLMEILGRYRENILMDQMMSQLIHQIKEIETKLDRKENSYDKP